MSNASNVLSSAFYNAIILGILFFQNKTLKLGKACRYGNIQLYQWQVVSHHDYISE